MVVCVFLGLIPTRHFLHQRRRISEPLCRYFAASVGHLPMLMMAMSSAYNANVSVQDKEFRGMSAVNTL